MFKCLLILLISLQINGQQIPSTAPDSTFYPKLDIENIFSIYKPNELLAIIKKNNTYEHKTRQAIQMLSYSIPTLNPIGKAKVTSAFGYRIHPIFGTINLHSAIDITGNLNDPIYAAADGIVSEVGYNSSLGNFIKIEHHLGFKTLYGHLSDYKVKKGDIVLQGQTVGYCGATGHATGYHLHFGILHNNNYINPKPFIFNSQ